MSEITTAFDGRLYFERQPKMSIIENLGGESETVTSKKFVYTKL